jgi:Transglutaminase-like superfamily
MMHPANILVRQLWRRFWYDRVLLLEATFWLAVAALAIAVLPFGYLGRLVLLAGGRQVPPQRARLAEVRRIRWAIVACARRIPWRAMCFERGLAAQFMLRRRGIPAVLYYGAAPDNRHGLSAHVWVRVRDMDVIGGEIASRYAVLTTLPAQNANTAREGLVETTR